MTQGNDSETFTSRLEVPEGDPDNALSRAEIEEKMRSLVGTGGVSSEEVDLLTSRAWTLRTERDMRDLLLENV